MADEPELEPEEEQVEERAAELFQALGISELDYPEILDLSIRHAQLARPAAVPPDAPWVAVGPRNLGGRIISIVQDPANALTLYAGSAQGGLWRTIDGGDMWEHLGGPEHHFPVGALAIPERQPRTIYAGTGALLPSQVSGSGLFRVDVAGPRGAATFHRLATAPAAHISPSAAANGAALRYTRIEADPDDPERFWAASQTGLWRCKASGTPPVPVWVRDFPPAANAPQGTRQLETGPIPGPAGTWPPYATDLRVARDPRDTEPWAGNRTMARYLILYLAIDGDGIFRGRYDRQSDSVTWDPERLHVPDPAPALPSPFTRVLVAICRRRPEHVYAVMANAPGSSLPEHDHATFVYRSTDCGDHWQQRGRIPRAYLYTDTVAASADGQASYDLVLEVNPDNPDVLLCGEIDLCKSEDGGSTWVPIMEWQNYNSGDRAQHGDQHFAIFDAADRRKVWSGNDGGLSLARDLRLPAGSQGFWRKRSHGILAGQFQDVTVHPAAALSFISGGGLQDNGTYLTFGGPTWYQIGDGDGGMMAIHAANPRLFLSSVQYRIKLASIVAPSLASSIVHPASPDLLGSQSLGVMSTQLDAYMVPNPANPLKGPFIGTLEQDPATPGQILIGWTSDPTVVPAVTVAYWAASPGGIGAPGAVAPIAGPGVAAVPRGEQASAVAFGPVIAGVAGVDGWIGTTDGRLLQTTTAPAAGWSATPAALPQPGGLLRQITRVAVHAADPRIVAVSSVLSLRAVQVSISTAGLVGASQFQVQLFGLGVWGPLSAAQPTANLVTVPGTLITLSFGAGNYAAGDSWIILTTGAILPAAGNASAGVLTAAASQAVPIVVRITVAGALAAASFTYQIGALPASAAQPTAAVFAVPGSLATLRFSAGNYVAGDSWTIALDGTPTAAGGNTSGGAVSAEMHPGARVHLTYDRGVSWIDASHPAGGPAAPALDPASLPPCPVSSLRFDLAAPAALSLFAGTLVGVYVLRNLPTPAALAIAPAPAAASLPVGQSIQLKAELTLSVIAAPFDCTMAADWSTSAVGLATVNNTGLVNAVAAGAATITVRRGTLTATLAVIVTAGGAALPAPAAPAPMGQPAVAVSWRPFNNRLPLVLVNDIETVPGTRILRVATFGRGVWECDLAGGPQHWLFLRQTVIEDGRTYPRVIPPGLNDDPRLPAGTVGLDFTHAFDIRVDAAPLQFFDDRLDGVEFDEELGADTLVPLRRNAVYVQVHNRGWDPVANATVHLYFLATPTVAPAGVPPTVPVPAGLTATANFYNPPSFDPTPGPNAWQRVGPAQTIPRVASAEPVVVRFDWDPPAAFAGGSVALLALCTTGTAAASHDPLPTPLPATRATILQLVTEERRAALRIVPVGPLAPATLYVRDGVDDDSRNGAVAFAGRSSDIIVVQEEVADPSQSFRDLLELRPQDKVKASNNHVFIRVQNRGVQAANAEVHVWAVALDATHTPSFAPATWTRLTPVAGMSPAPQPVPAGGAAFVTVPVWGAPDPNPGDAYKAYGIVALVRNVDAGEALPDTASITSLDTFWDFFGKLFDSHRAALRVLRYEP